MSSTPSSNSSMSDRTNTHDEYVRSDTRCPLPRRQRLEQGTVIPPCTISDMKHSQPLRPLKVFTLSRHDPHVIAASQAGTSAHTRPRALSSPFTFTTTQMACHTRWPNADKYPDDKAEHDTLSAEEVLDLYESNYDLGLKIQARPCLLYTSPSPRDRTRSRMPSSA